MYVFRYGNIHFINQKFKNLIYHINTQNIDQFCFGLFIDKMLPT